MHFIEANGARIPGIGLGTYDLREAAGTRIIEQALRLGYRHVDTAQIYNNESEVGEGLRGSRVKRNDVFITTKVWVTNYAPKDFDRSVKESLSKLRLSEVDLLLLHFPPKDIPLQDTLGSLAKAKKAGMARHIGLSNFTVALIEEAVRHCSEPLVCNQVEYHPYLNQNKVIEACARHGLALIAYTPIARGNVKKDEVLAEIGRKYGKTAAQICLRWLVQQNAIPIPRTSKIERLSENLDVFDFELSDEEMQVLFGMGSSKGRMTNLPIAPEWD